MALVLKYRVDLCALLLLGPLTLLVPICPTFIEDSCHRWLSLSLQNRYRNLCLLP